MTRARPFGLFLLLLAVVLGLSTWTPAAADPVPGNGVLQGVIRDDNGERVNGVLVEAYVNDGSYAGEDPVGTATTATVIDDEGEMQQGFYSLSLPPGSYALRFVADPTFQWMWGPVVTEGGTTRADFTLDWVPGDGVSNGTFTGYVLNTEGNYLDDISVEAIDLDTGLVEATAITYEGLDHGHGFYRLEVPPGTYGLRYSSMDGTSYRTRNPEEFYAIGGGRIKPLDDVTMIATDEPVVTGQVRTTGGLNVSRPWVRVFVLDEGDWDSIGEFRANMAGNFIIPVPDESVITLRVGASGYRPSYLGGGTALPETPTGANSRTVDGGDVDAGTITVEQRGPALGRVAGQDLAYCKDNVLPRNDDDSTDAIDIPFPLSFFGAPYDELYVNNNGNITFNESSSDFTPDDLTGPTEVPIIAPFFTDIDTRPPGSGEVTYGASPDGDSFCVNWDGVGHFSQHDEVLNTFQLILTRARGADTAAGDFDITFNYDAIEWDYDGDAAVGFSAGTGDDGTYVQLPGSFERGALLDGGPDALIAGFQGSVQPGRYIFPVRNTGVVVTLGGLHGLVEDSDSDPVAGAYVEACRGSYCRTALTREDGTYSFTALPTGSYTVSVSPPDGSDLFPAAGSGTVLSGGDTDAGTIVMQAPRPMPSGVSLVNADPDEGFMDPFVPADGPPIVHYMADLSFSVGGCPGVVNPTVTEFVGGSVLHGGPIAMAEVTPGHYTAVIPSSYPEHGEGSIVTNVPETCGGSPIAFDIYIDPSGVVTDQYGRPAAGATVELQRADTLAGPFTAVADGSAVMSPSNRTNPDTTDGVGFFRWDVISGAYKVKASKTGCTDVTTPAMEVPPERIDLLIKMTCSAAMPAPTTAPVLSGTSQVGQTLSVTSGAWGDGIVRYQTQWLRGGGIVGTGSSYPLTGADLGQQITARVVAKRPDYTQENNAGDVVTFDDVTFEVTSGVVTAASGGGGGGGGSAQAPVATTLPSVGGVAKVGQTLTANPGSWDTTGLAFAYQWMRAGSAIAGANGVDYTAVAADLGKAISVKVTASRSGIPDGTATSAPATVGIGDAPQTLSPPVVTGETAVGGVLEVTSGSWDTPGLDFGYQWTRDGSAIAGATDPSYVVTELDRGHALAALVTATKDGYAEGSAAAAAVDVPEGPGEPEPATSTTTAKLKKATVKAGTRGVLVVTVARSDAEEAAGKVQIWVDGRKVGAARLVDGRAVVELPKLKPGTHKVKAVYGGGEDVEGSTSAVVRLTVTKPKKQQGGHHRVQPADSRLVTAELRFPSLF